MLKRGIKKWDLVLLMINSIIGAGIFGLPSKVFKLSGVYSLVAFFVCAIVITIIILVFAEVSSRFDKTGGPYLYTLEAFGRFPAFLMGWLLLLNRIFGFSTLINLLVIYLSVFSLAFNTPVLRMASILLIILLLAYINHMGVKNSTRLNNILTVSKLVPLALFIIIGLFNIQPELLSFSSTPSLSSFSSSVFLLIFAFGGFEAVLINSGEMHNPAKNLPFALLLSVLVVTIFYCLVQFVSIGTLPTLASSEKPLADAAGLFMGRGGDLLIACGAFVSIFGTLNSIMLNGSRLPFALSNEDQFPKLFSFVHPKYFTPTWSLLLFTLVTTAVSLAWSFMGALAVAVIIRILVYLIVCLSLIKLRKKKPEGNYFKAPFGYLLAIIGIIVSIWLLSGTKWNEIIVFSIFALTGLIFYGIYMGFKKTKTKKA